MDEFGLDAEGEGGEGDGMEFGLVPKAIETDSRLVAMQVEQERDVGIGSSRGTSETPRQRDATESEEADEGDDDAGEFPSHDQLRSMRDKLDQLEAGDDEPQAQRDAYKKVVR